MVWFDKTLNGLSPFDADVRRKNVQISMNDLLTFGNLDFRSCEEFRSFLSVGGDSEIIVTPSSKFAPSLFIGKNHFLDCKNGRLKVSPKEYMEMAAKIGAEFVVAPFDSFVNSGQNRRSKAFERTRKSLKECIGYKGETSNVKVLGAIPLMDCEESLRLLNDIFETKGLDGIYLYYNDQTGNKPKTPKMDEISIIIDKISSFSSDFPVFLDGFDSLMISEESFEIIETVSVKERISNRPIGFISKLSAELTARKLFLRHKTETETRKFDDRIEIRGVLGIEKPQTNALRLVDDCGCFTCENHSVSYLKHLLKIEELNGWILLQRHNSQVFEKQFQR